MYKAALMRIRKEDGEKVIVEPTRVLEAAGKVEIHTKDKVFATEASKADYNQARKISAMREKMVVDFTDFPVRPAASSSADQLRT